MPDATPFPEQVQQAVDRLFGLPFERFVRPTLRRLGLPHTGNKPVLRGVVAAAAAGTDAHYRVELPRLVAEVDARLETGLHHVFLFRFPEEERELRLAQLRDPAWVRSRVEAIGRAASYGGDEFVWDAEAPELTSARHLDSPPRLVLKWVESRHWEEKVGETLDAETGNRLEIFAPRRERSVNFFSLDLATGDSTIAIQELQPNARVPLQDELALYRQALRELLGFDPCDRVLLEPVARRLLLEAKAEIKRWAVILPGGDFRNGAHREKFKLPRELARGVFAAVETEFESRPARGAKTAVRVKVDARADYLEIGEPTLPAHHAAILASARKRGEDEIHDPDLRTLAAREPELRPVLRKIDLLLARLAPESIDSRPLVADDWLDRELVRRAFAALAALDPQRFGVRWYVYKPATKETGKARRLKEYADRGAIPEEVEVRHKQRRVRVPTTDNVWPELLLPQAKPQARTALPQDFWIVLACLALFVVILVLMLAVPNPTPSQERVLHVLLALAAAGVGAALPGILKFHIKSKKLNYSLRATGSLGLFALIYLVPPTGLDTTRSEPALRFELARPVPFEQALAQIEGRFGRTVTLRCGERERRAMLRGKAVEAPSLPLLVERLRHLAVDSPLAYEVREIEGVGLEVVCPAPAGGPAEAVSAEAR